MIYVFKCSNNHVEERYRPRPYKNRVKFRCKECGMWMKRDIQGEHAKGTKVIHLDDRNDPISHLASKRSFKGIMIEHLTHEPVFVTSKKQYDKILKDTHSMEKRTGYAGR